MLPAFPKIEDFCDEVSSRLIEHLAAQRAPILSIIQKHVQFEGDHAKIFRHDETVGDTPLHPATAEVRFSTLPLTEFLEEELPKQLNDAAEQLAKGVSEIMYAQMERITAEVGNVVDAGGQPLSEELILKTLDKVEHSFEPDGTWNPPTLLASPEAVERLMRSANADGSGSVEFRTALARILDKKRDDFRRREADRVLAG